MLIVKNSLILFSLFMFSPLMAEDHVYIFGGKGEPAGETTIFDKNAEYYSKITKSMNKPTVAVHFNGGHSTTETILRKQFSTEEFPSHGFTEVKLKEKLNELMNKIQTGKIKRGEKVLILVDTHGSKKVGDEKTHLVSIGEKISNANIIDTATISLDLLIPLTKLAEQKGVNLGILDFSCHSGSSLTLANSKTCVITATGPKHYAYAGKDTFGNTFLGNIKKGKNLEDIYLDTLNKYNDKSTPMISTEAGKKSYDDLYQLLTPFLFHQKTGGVDSLQETKFSDFVRETYSNGSYQCFNDSFQELVLKVKKLQAISSLMINDSKNNYDAYTELVKDLSEYQKIYESVFAELDKNGVFLENERENFCTDYLQGKELKKTCKVYSIKELALLEDSSVTESISRLEDLINNKFLKEYKNQKIAEIKNLKSAHARSKELKKFNLKFRTYADVISTISDLENKTQKYSTIIFKNFRKIIQDAYRLNSLKSNPAYEACAQFKF